MKKLLISIFILLVLTTPVLSFAAIVPCTNTPDAAGKITDPCDFNAFMELINNVIDFMLLNLALPIAAIMFAYAGFLMVTAGESASEARTKAKGIFGNVVMGLVIALACWIIVHSILKILGYEGSWIGL